MRNRKALAMLIDHTLLKPESTPAMVEQLCTEAMTHHFYSVCILPTFVTQAVALLKHSEVKVGTVIAFPLGASVSRVKATETRIAVEQGADEIDMVLNIGLLKSAGLAQMKADIVAVVDAAQGRTVKVILETCLLSNEEKIQACTTCVEAGAHFVKTSTGFSSGGATVVDVRLLRETVGPDTGVKASGGIRDYRTACDMVEAGASRLGTSAGLIIVGAGAEAAADSY